MDSILEDRRGGTGDPMMLERLENSVLGETLKKAFFSISLGLVPYSYSLSFEGTVGVTIDDKRILFLHFSDTVNKSEDDAVGSAVQGLPQLATKTSVCSSHLPSNVHNKISAPVAFLKGHSEFTKDSTKHSSLLSNVHPKLSIYSSEDVQSIQPECLAAAEACLELSMEKSTTARRKGRPARFPSDGVAIFTTASSNHVPSVCSVTAKEQTDLSPQVVQSYYVSTKLDESEALDFSARSKVESFKRNTPDFSVTTSENPRCSGLQTGLSDNEIERAQMKDGASNQKDRTLLRQLLLNNTKTKKAKPIKRRLSGSDDYANKKTCLETSLCVDENSKIDSFGLLLQEPDTPSVDFAVKTTPSLRGSFSKKTEVKGTDDSGGERRANPDSILCRLLTSGVNMYDTTEVERLRQMSANKLKVARDRDVSGSVGRNTVTMDQLGGALVDLMATNIKSEKELCIVTDEHFTNMPLEPTESKPLYFESNVRCHTSNSPLGPLPRIGLGPLRNLPDAAVTTPPQFQTNCNIADHCLAIVKEEHDDCVDVHRTLHASAANSFPSDAQTKENLYQACFTESLDFRK